MDSIPEDEILQFNEDTFQSVRRDYNLDKPGAMDQAIDLLEEWIKKQDHFTKKDFPRDNLERSILGSKGSVERAKTRLDKLCTLRTMLPSLFETVDFKTECDYSSFMVHALLPKLTDDHYRIYALKNIGKYLENGLTNYYRFVIAIFEYVLAHDYCKGVIIIMEFSDLNFVELMKKLNLVEMRQTLTLLIDGYGMIAKAIHIVTPSKTVEVLVSILKQILSSKIGARIQTHKDLNSLYSHVSKDILPVDQGGKQRPLTELHDKWARILSSSDFQKYFNKMKVAKTNEAYRHTDKFNDDYMGIAGTFRSLNVD